MEVCKKYIHLNEENMFDNEGKHKLDSHQWIDYI